MNIDIHTAPEASQQPAMTLSLATHYFFIVPTIIQTCSRVEIETVIRKSHHQVHKEQSIV
jgi:hypothetical protein